MDYDREITANIELAGSFAPGATIVVYFAPNTTSGVMDVMQAMVNDITNAPSVLSISWGNTEENPFWSTPAIPGQTSGPTVRDAFEDLLLAASVKGITVLAEVGDWGATDQQPDDNVHVEYPASSPNVTGCGGSFLTLSGSTISSEVVWNNPSSGTGFADKTTGGGVSRIFPLPSWQNGYGVPTDLGVNRGVPDVCGHADSYAIVLRGANDAFWGTSAVAPLWAGLIARINQKITVQVGFANPFFYEPSFAATFHDVTSGTNGAWNAGSGWDPCTGLGSPDGGKLADLFAQGGVGAHVVTVPAWGGIEDVDRGSPNANPPLPSAAELGLHVSYVEVANNGQGDAADIISINPAAGTVVPVGSDVTVEFWGLGPND